MDTSTQQQDPNLPNNKLDCTVLAFTLYPESGWYTALSGDENNGERKIKHRYVSDSVMFSHIFPAEYHWVSTCLQLCQKVQHPASKESSTLLSLQIPFNHSKINECSIHYLSEWEYLVDHGVNCGDYVWSHWILSLSRISLRLLSISGSHKLQVLRLQLNRAYPAGPTLF